MDGKIGVLSAAQHLDPFFEKNRHAVRLGTKHRTFQVHLRCLAQAALPLERELDEHPDALGEGFAGGEETSGGGDVSCHQAESGIALFRDRDAGGEPEGKPFELSRLLPPGGLTCPGA